ncbi:MAG TPA: pepsin/retropepsin-like aspartic protease family protein [Puia sp.]|nr:pepsin/retropepsin-like aspartic protease family protein [Puia sp.]
MRTFLTLPATRFLVLFTTALTILTGCRQTDNPALIHRLQSLVDQEEYCRLDNQFQAVSPSLSPEKKRYFTAYLDNAFNRNAECVATIDSLLNDPALKQPDSIKANLVQLQGDSYFKLGEYAKAAHCEELIINKYGKAVDSTTLDDTKNSLLTRNALKNTPPQQTVIPGNTTIHWTRNSIGIIEIPLITAGQTVNAIFDTRANISSITKTYAEKLHLHLLDVSYREGAGVTGAEFQVGLGVADSLYIGNILVKNAVFQVMPDSIFYIAPIKFQLNIILGLPVIAQLQEVRFYKDGRLIIPQTPVLNDVHNLFLVGLDPVLTLISDNDTLGFHFDSGASSSVLYSTYFRKYRTAIARNAVKKTQSFGGAGGVRKKETYTLPSLHLSLGNKTVAVDSVSVLTEKIWPGEKLYGNIGQDFIKQFNELTIDFKYMYVTGN